MALKMRQNFFSFSWSWRRRRARHRLVSVCWTRPKEIDDNRKWNGNCVTLCSQKIDPPTSFRSFLFTSFASIKGKFPIQSTRLLFIPPGTFSCRWRSPRSAAGKRKDSSSSSSSSSSCNFFFIFLMEKVRNRFLGWTRPSNRWAMENGKVKRIWPLNVLCCVQMSMGFDRTRNWMNCAHDWTRRKGIAVNFFPFVN